VVTRGQHHDVGVGERAQLPTHLQAVHSWQPEIQYDDVGVELAGYGDGVRAVDGDSGLELLALQITGDHLGQGCLIVDYQRPISTPGVD